MTEKQQALQDIRRRQFALIDAGMYLNSHPDDQNALQYYRTMRRQKEQADAAYQKHFGALTLSQAGQGERWDWIDDPWPWEGE